MVKGIKGHPTLENITCLMEDKAPDFMVDYDLLRDDIFRGVEQLMVHFLVNGSSEGKWMTPFVHEMFFRLGNVYGLMVQRLRNASDQRSMEILRDQIDRFEHDPDLQEDALARLEQEDPESYKYALECLREWESAVKTLEYKRTLPPTQVTNVRVVHNPDNYIPPEGYKLFRRRKSYEVFTDEARRRPPPADSDTLTPPRSRECRVTFIPKTAPKTQPDREQTPPLDDVDLDDVDSSC